MLHLRIKQCQPLHKQRARSYIRRFQLNTFLFCKEQDKKYFSSFLIDLAIIRNTRKLILLCLIPHCIIFLENMRRIKKDSLYWHSFAIRGQALPSHPICEFYEKSQSARSHFPATLTSILAHLISCFLKSHVFSLTTSMSKIIFKAHYQLCHRFRQANEIP